MRFESGRKIGPFARACRWRLVLGRTIEVNDTELQKPCVARQEKKVREKDTILRSILLSERLFDELCTFRPWYEENLLRFLG